MNKYNNFFDRNDFIVNEKLEVLTFSNRYRLFSLEGEEIGSIIQRVPNMHKILRLFLGKKMMPFEFDILDKDENVLIKVKRGWTLFFSKIEMQTPNGETIGIIDQHFTMINPKFQIEDRAKNVLGLIKGNWIAWDFKITDANEDQIGTINKKWAGVAKEFFTSADNYHVNIDERVSEDQTKMLILTAALTIDMVLKEN